MSIAVVRGMNRLEKQYLEEAEKSWKCCSQSIKGGSSVNDSMLKG